MPLLPCAPMISGLRWLSTLADESTTPPFYQLQCSGPEGCLLLAAPMTTRLVATMPPRPTEADRDAIALRASPCRRLNTRSRASPHFSCRRADYFRRRSFRPPLAISHWLCAHSPNAAHQRLAAAESFTSWHCFDDRRRCPTPLTP